MAEQAEVTMVTLTVNGTTVTEPVEPRTLLSDFLRHELGLTGTHVGCEQGVCGACTVLVDGVVVRSCLTFAVPGRRRETVETVESLAEGDELHPLQQAFQDNMVSSAGSARPGS